MIAARLATLRDGQHKAGASEDAATQSDAATLLSVSRPSVQRARFVKDHGVPDLAEAVEHGEVKVSAAAEFAKQNAPLDQQRLIVEHGSPADAVKATVKAKADRAEAKPQKPKPNITPAADRAEQAAAAKATASPPEALIAVIEQLERINVSAAVNRMTNDERTELLMQLVKANEWINKTAVDIAISRGAKLGKLAPMSLRFEALEFLREATARIEAELADRAVRESAA